MEFSHPKDAFERIYKLPLEEERKSGNDKFDPKLNPFDKEPLIKRDKKEENSLQNFKNLKTIQEE